MNSVKDMIELMHTYWGEGDEVHEDLDKLSELHEKEVKQIRAEVINNFVVNAITEFQKFDKEHGYPTLGDISIILSDVAEQLKEQNK